MTNKMETHIVEQREDGICFPIEHIYLVRETQEYIGQEDDLKKNETVFVYTDEEDAINKARELNKKYGKACIFSDDWDFEEINYDECYTEDLHYFDVEKMKINK